MDTSYSLFFFHFPVLKVDEKIIMSSFLFCFLLLSRRVCPVTVTTFEEKIALLWIFKRLSFYLVRAVSHLRLNLLCNDIPLATLNDMQKHFESEESFHLFFHLFLSFFVLLSPLGTFRVCILFVWLLNFSTYLV